MAQAQVWAARQCSNMAPQGPPPQLKLFLPSFLPSWPAGAQEPSTEQRERRGPTLVPPAGAFFGGNRGTPDGGNKRGNEQGNWGRPTSGHGLEWLPFVQPFAPPCVVGRSPQRTQEFLTDVGAHCGPGGEAGRKNYGINPTLRLQFARISPHRKGFAQHRNFLVETLPSTNTRP